jgi:hypothetical protein
MFRLRATIQVARWIRHGNSRAEAGKWRMKALMDHLLDDQR